MGGGGAERQLVYLSEGLLRLGWDVHVILADGGPNLARLQASGVSIYRAASAGNYDPRAFYSVARIMKQVKPAVVQAWLLKMEVLAGFAARLSGLPWIFTERSSHGAYPDGWRSRLHIQMGRMATAIVANSAEGERFWAERGASGVPRRLIPNALPIAEIASTPPAVGDHLNVAPDRRIVLFVGRFSPEKNLSTLVRALSMVSPHLNIIGVLAGVGPDHEKIAQEAKALNMGEQIRLPGYVNNVWGLMKKADVFVSPAFFEGRPNTVLEAMACGCPLILSDIPAHRELVSGEAALFTKADRPEELAQAISRTLEDPSAATARARVARNIVDRYTVDRMAKDYDSLYRTIAAGRTDSVAAERRRAPIQ